MRLTNDVSYEEIEKVVMVIRKNTESSIFGNERVEKMSQVGQEV